MNDDERLRRIYRGALDRQPPLAGPAPTPEELEALAGGRLTGDPATQLLDRVMADPRLQAEFELLRATHVAGRQLSRPLVPRWLAVAAVVTLTASGLLTWRAWRTDGPTVVRGGTTVALAAPVAAASVAPPVRLVWRSVPNALRYRLEVIDDAGAAIVSTILPDTSLVLAPGQVTAGASYRWWIEVSLSAGGSARSEVRRFTVTDGAGGPN